MIRHIQNTWEYPLTSLRRNLHCLLHTPKSKCTAVGKSVSREKNNTTGSMASIYCVSQNNADGAHGSDAAQKRDYLNILPKHGAQGGERTHPAHTALVGIWFCVGSALVLNLGFFVVWVFCLSLPSLFIYVLSCYSISSTRIPLA